MASDSDKTKKEQVKRITPLSFTYYSLDDLMLMMTEIAEQKAAEIMMDHLADYEHKEKLCHHETQQCPYE